MLIMITCYSYQYRYHNHYNHRYSTLIYSTSKSSSLVDTNDVISTNDVTNSKRTKGHPHNDDSRKKISEANKGKKPWNVGINYYFY